jgi:hypothetical protein
VIACSVGAFGDHRVARKSATRPAYRLRVWGSIAGDRPVHVSGGLSAHDSNGAAATESIADVGV